MADRDDRRANRDAERLYRGRETAGRYLAVNEFPSYDAAMQNSQLPETSALAETVGALVEITAYWNLDLVLDMPADEVRAMASALVDVFATCTGVWDAPLLGRVGQGGGGFGRVWRRVGAHPTMAVASAR